MAKLLLVDNEQDLLAALQRILSNVGQEGLYWSRQGSSIVACPENVILVFDPSPDPAT